MCYRFGTEAWQLIGRNISSLDVYNGAIVEASTNTAVSLYVTASNVEASFLQILSEIYHKKASTEQQASVDSGNMASVDIKGTPKKKKAPCC